MVRIMRRKGNETVRVELDENHKANNLEEDLGKGGLT